jgi:RHH-type transcriptional regulator, proline utilization regulon repressor / proline dehydrogenase / delta 1-pyrroline-5-carboxylate dehydrogenase
MEPRRIHGYRSQSAHDPVTPFFWMSDAMQPFRAPYAPDDGEIARDMMRTARLSLSAEARIDAEATLLIEAIRARSGGIGGIEDVLREYSLSTKEGLALMVLAEALLRVPDAATADKLIEDKLGAGDFAEHETKSSSFLVNASAWALGITARVIQPGETPEGIIASLAKRLGLPTVRAATRQAMRVMGNHFVLGQTIDEALSRATSGKGRLYRYSFDMLGEGARTASDAERYWQSYSDAIARIGRSAGNQALPDRPGISVKLSALHPRYEAVSRQRVLSELVPKTIELARQAKQYDLNFTIDAEEADRLELSLDVIALVASDTSLAGWDGFGLAVQAYQKRGQAVIDWLIGLADHLDRKFMVRLVKGAYWDSEVKRSQERGLADFPVFTRKAMTDMHYIACADRMLAARNRLYPQFATHNALTVATIIERAGGVDGYEFQRLHGMGEALFSKLLETRKGTACRTYAPVGGHKDLLAYLVRRLLENGANSSFVSVSADPAVTVKSLLKRPADVISDAAKARHARIPLPKDLYGVRQNSAGIEFGYAADLDLLQKSIVRPALADVYPLIGTDAASGRLPARMNGRKSVPLASPIDGETIGAVYESSEAEIAEAMRAGRAAFATWSRMPAGERATILRKAADRLERERGEALALLQAEAGKTLDDALAELREAADFLRYYADESERHFAAEGRIMPGPTGEENRLTLRGRGVFGCISPWNFPLAIFLGQISAALAAGNAVIAKPAEQTPQIAFWAVRLMHAAGVPAGALQLVLGDGRIGAALVNAPGLAGICFTGSTEVARLINRALAAKDGPIVPLIAETGGINAMIVDATALPEQVADDVVLSAFRSAGQRCSALRLLCVQEDVADKMIEMIVGAARELQIGDPRAIETHIGPVIDGEAKAKLDLHISSASSLGKLLYKGAAPERTALSKGHFVAPAVIEIKRASDLKAEVFGPVLHVARYKAAELPALLEAIEGSGYGLTLGVHSRIDTTIAAIIDRLAVGNVYVNRNMIGAVVGTQPFGGSGLSGTGPKAGGPHYLLRFAEEQHICVNTAAAGGNASLVAMGEE